MRHLGCLFLSMLFALPAFAEDVFVVNVMRNIPLSDEEPIYKDFYLNAGEAAGLKKNLVVTVVRKVAIHDASGAQAYGDIEVPVGQLRILAVYGRVAVAREYKLLSRDENPMLEQTGLLVGDKVDLKGSFVDSKGWTTPKRKVTENEDAAGRSTASVTAPAPVPAPAAATPTPAVPGETKKVAASGMPAEFVKPSGESAKK